MPTHPDSAADRLDRLEARVLQLESSLLRARPGPVPADATLGETESAEIVEYHGQGASHSGRIAWRSDRAWSEVEEAAPARAAAALAAVASPLRVSIILALIRGPLTTRELIDRLDAPSTGQLFHHLKDLLVAGIVYQPMRGTYAVLHQHVVPLLVILSAALDVSREAAAEVPG